MSEYDLGSTHKRNDVEFRVVRIINASVSLFEDEKGAYVQAESYVELKGSDGSIEFVPLAMERTPYEGPTSIIKGLSPINWGNV